MLKSVTLPLSLLAVMTAAVIFIVAQAPASSPAGGSKPRASNPCAAAPANPCAPRAANPCAAAPANPCAAR